MAAVKYRASPHIVAYWQDGRLIVHHFASGVLLTADPVVLQILHVCRSWRGMGEIVRQLTALPAPVVEAAVDALSQASFLRRSDRHLANKEAAYDSWNGWNPAAGFFHSATRGVRWPTPLENAKLNRALVKKARAARVPPPLKQYRGASRVTLPPARGHGEFASVLVARRTWRTFSRRALPLDDLGTLLGLTAGVQMWGVSSAGHVRVPFTTSPSAGSKHPLELYVAARRVSGLSPGVYHYAADRHQLERVAAAVSSRQLERLLGGQWYFKNAAAVVFMTAVWARTQWTYSYARAYRSVLAEAGHVCQTFCLVATWLNLAPFCTMALADAEIEKVLVIDGVTEAVLYAAGVGMKPTGGRWTQWPEQEARRQSDPGQKRRSPARR